jgi:hypothetical protein
MSANFGAGFRWIIWKGLYAELNLGLRGVFEGSGLYLFGMQPAFNVGWKF